MQFMIMMIPAVYREDKKLDKKFVPDQKKFRRRDDSMRNYPSK